MKTNSFKGIAYELTRKRVKNINMRIGKSGILKISAPSFVPLREIEGFIEKKEQWIINAKLKQEQLVLEGEKPPEFSKAECLTQATDLSDKIFPLFADILNGKRPIIKVRTMKTRWGVCHIQKRSITINTRLFEKPLPAQEYVMLHEYVHFLHPDHGKGFYTALAALMPDYKTRRALLK